MTMDRMYLPGEAVETSGVVSAGRGAYVDEEGVLRASIAGQVVVVDGAASVVGAGRTADAPMARDLVIKVGSVVTGRVVRINQNQATLDLLTVDGHALSEPLPKGSVRKEDVRLSSLDSLLMQDCFIPGDLIKAKVISLGDTRTYFLSTSAVEFGVTHAVSATTGAALLPVSWDKMQDPGSTALELRKVAKPDA